MKTQASSSARLASSSRSSILSFGDLGIVSLHNLLDEALASSRRMNTSNSTPSALSGLAAFRSGLVE